MREGRRNFSVNRPMLVVVLNAWVTEVPLRKNTLHAEALVTHNSLFPGPDR